MKFRLEIELQNDGIANRGDLERSLLSVAQELNHRISQSFSSVPDESEHILGEQGVIVGKWEVVADDAVAADAVLARRLEEAL